MRQGSELHLTALLVTLILLLSLTTLSAVAVTSTINVKTDKPAYSGSDVIQISGTVTPAPKPNATSAFVKVTSPAGAIVAAAPAVVTGTNGTFQYKFNSGGTKSWTSGTYTVNASWAASIDVKPIWNTTTFQYSPTVTTTTTTSTTTTTTTSSTTTSSTTTTSTTTTTNSTSSSSSTSTTSSTKVQSTNSTTSTTVQTTSAGGTGVLSTINLIGIGVVAVGVGAAVYLLRRRAR